jgi:hypothetical protein
MAQAGVEAFPNPSGARLDSAELQRSVAFCGLVCHFCFMAAQCAGCRVAGCACPGPEQDGDCVHRRCCLERGLEGCWQCPGLGTCQSGLFAPARSSKVKAFATFIQEEGLARFITALRAGRARGWRIEKGGDYDGKPEAAVRELLRAAALGR